MLQTVQWASSVKAGDVDGQDEEVFGGSGQVCSQRLPHCRDQCAQARLQTCGGHSSD